MSEPQVTERDEGERAMADEPATDEAISRRLEDPQARAFETDTSATATATIRRALREVPVLRRGLGVTFLLAAFGAVGRVVVPVLIQLAVDDHIVGRDDVDVSGVVGLAVVAALVVLASGLAFRQAAMRLGDRSERALYDLRERLIGHIHRLSLSDHGEERRGGLVARVTSDIETLAQFFQWGGMAWLRSSTVMVIVAAVMLAYDWVLACVAFAIALPLVVVLRAVQHRLVRAHGIARERNGEMLGALAEVVSGSATIRAYGAGSTVAAGVGDSAEQKARAQIKAALLGAFLFPSGEVFNVFTIVSVVGVGIWRGPESGLTAGALIGFVFLTYRFLEPVAEFTEIIDQTQTAVAGMQRVLTVLDMPIGPPEPSDPTPLPAGALDISVRHLDFAYPARQDDRVPSELVLRDVDVVIPGGQQVALVGETGSGKTTLGKLIARFVDPTAGAVELGGVDLRRVGGVDLRRRLTVVSQEPFLLDTTIAENLLFAWPDADDAAVRRVIEELDVEEWIDSLPAGLNTRVGQRGEGLSAGERQLVALVRVGLADPDVLILDEATSSVDALTEVRIARALDRLAAGRTTIAIAHRLSTAARSDRILVLDDGRLVQDGHHEQLVAADGVYRRLYEAWVSATSV